MDFSQEEKQKIFEQFRVSMGWPNRKVELDDDQLCVLLEISIEDYAQYTQEWLIEHQWMSLLGKNIDTVDMAFALSVRSLDFSTSYTFAYSKQVGLQTRGPWELKKDYINVEAGRQVYEIPAGREINEVLWVTPPTTDRALFANYGGLNYGLGGGFAQMGSGGGAMGAGMGGAGMGGYFIAPAYDILLTASDFNLKNRILRSELVYKITKGPNNTRLLHLLSTPGSKFSFGGAIGNQGVGGGINLTGCQVWYHYYDVDPTDVDECRRLNPDIILTPNDVPLAKLDYSKFNEPTKTLIRQLFVSEAKRALGRTRGKFGGIVGPPDAERTMDYDSLLSEGNEERRMVLERLDTRLDRLSSTKMLERAANEAEYLNRALKFRPMGFWIK
jgi:hypothetical protein